MPKTPRLIQDPREIADVARALEAAPFVGIDTEFIRETTFFPKIALIQLSTEKAAWLLDPTTMGNKDLEPVLETLKNPSILKLMHAAYADQECLYWAYGFVAEPVLDTAVAAALTGYGDNVGLGKLLRDVLGVSLPKGRARVKWLARPLPAELLQYAEQDVLHLVPLARTLEEKLKRLNRWDWAMEESLVPILAFETPPEETAKRMAKSGHLDAATFPVLVELLRWREGRARSANMPRAWVADNETLIALAKVRPGTIEQLKSFRGLHGREVERSGKAILDAVKLGKEKEPDPSMMFTRSAPVEREDHLAEFIRTYVSFLADKHAIALRYLINTGKAHALANAEVGDSKKWVEEGILSRHAAELIGPEIEALLSGRRGLILKNGRVEILSL